MKIGNITIENNTALAPMAGVTDLAFRQLCREMGCGLLYTEMVSAKAILYKNKNTFPLLETAPAEHPIAVQIFGSDADIMADMAAKLAEERSFDIIDINMGCPVPKIVNNHEGSALMKNPKLAGEIVSVIVRSIEKPVTGKIRSGFDKDHINAVEMAKVVEDAGAAAVTVHGRTREQFYAGQADWEIIAKVKEAVSIPVIGNGDVTDGKSAENLLRQTGCDGVMVGRAARGNPWIFREINAYLKDGTMLPPKTNAECREMMLRHARLQLQYKGEYTGVREMRKHVSWYTAGMPHSARLREQVNTVENFAALEELIGQM